MNFSSPMHGPNDQALLVDPLYFRFSRAIMMPARMYFIETHCCKKPKAEKLLRCF